MPVYLHIPGSSGRMSVDMEPVPAAENSIAISPQTAKILLAMEFAESLNRL